MDHDLVLSARTGAVDRLNEVLPQAKAAARIECGPDERDDGGERLIEIRAADTEGHRSSAHVLVNRMYEWRGYTTAPMPEEAQANRVTLIACEGERTVGTITVAFDGAHGLLSDEAFGDDVGRLRDQGMVLCEFVKLAIDNVVRSKKILASLMHAAFICARETGGCETVLIEVSPRHVRFYREMLGFEILANARRNPRVDAPAVLMALDLDFADYQIGEAHRAPVGAGRFQRSLYRHGFSRDEVAGVTHRLRQASAERRVC